MCSAEYQKGLNFSYWYMIYVIYQRVIGSQLNTWEEWNLYSLSGRIITDHLETGPDPYRPLSSLGLRYWADLQGTASPCPTHSMEDIPLLPSVRVTEVIRKACRRNEASSGGESRWFNANMWLFWMRGSSVWSGVYHQWVCTYPNPSNLILLYSNINGYFLIQLNMICLV